MYDFCISHNILSDKQFGFRPGFCTETAILSVTNSWFSHLDNYNSVCAIFFDLKKAFDSVPHKSLLETLTSLLILYIYFIVILANRSQQVIINGSSSSKSPVLSGVPQGFILRLLLFNL